VEIAESCLQGCGRPYEIFRGKHLGMVENWNRCLHLAKGEYVKLLFHDDFLDPSCVEKLVSVCSSEVSFAFAPRRSILETRRFPSPLALNTYRAVSCSISCAWKPASSPVAGTGLLQDPGLLDGPLNKIGEPTSVLLNKAFLERYGAFDKDMGQFADLEMWLRWCEGATVGYYPEELSTFRIHDSQQTAIIQRSKQARRQLLLFYERLSGLPLSSRTQNQIEKRCRVIRFFQKHSFLNSMREFLESSKMYFCWLTWAVTQLFKTR
jgi:hypothetical protein